MAADAQEFSADPTADVTLDEAVDFAVRPCTKASAIPFRPEVATRTSMTIALHK